jgi:hypothetical protein
LASNSDATFVEVRTASIQAAIDLYGSSSNEVIQVTNAWYAVGLGEPAYSVSGPNFLCTSETYTITNLPTGATVTWSVTPSGVATVSGSGSSITVTRVGSANNNITLLANVNLGCGVISLKKEILVGAPLATLLNVTRDFTTNVGDEASFQAYYNGIGLCRSTSGGITEVQWTVDPSGGLVDIDDTDSRYCRLALTPGAGATLKFSTSGTKWLTVRAKNACGWSVYANFYIDVLP